jgi:hypothetical protein
MGTPPLPCLWQSYAASTAEPDGGSGQEEGDRPASVGFGSSPGAASGETTRGEDRMGREERGRLWRMGTGAGREGGRRLEWRGG